MSFPSVSAHVSKDKYVSFPHCPKFRPGPTPERPRICRCALRSGTWDAGGRWRTWNPKHSEINCWLVVVIHPKQIWLKKHFSKQPYVMYGFFTATGKELFLVQQTIRMKWIKPTLPNTFWNCPWVGFGVQTPSQTVFGSLGNRQQ